MVTAMERKSVLVGFIGDESLVVQCAGHARAAGVAVGFVASASEAVRAAATAAGLRAIAAVDAALAIEEEAPDALFSVANEFVLPAEVLTGVRIAVNFHDGPLPEYAGLGVTSWALIHGEAEHGITWHVMTEHVDQGDVLLARRFPITSDDTAFALNARCYESAIETFPAVLERVCRALQGEPSTTIGAGTPTRFFGRYQRPLVAVDPALAADVLDRGVRALDLGGRIRNRMGAARWTGTRRGQDVGVLVTGTEVRPARVAPGAVERHGSSLLVGTVDGDLAIVGATELDGTPLELNEFDIDGWETTVVTLAGLDEHLARHETTWLRRLAQVDPGRPEHFGRHTHAVTDTPRWAEYELAVAPNASIEATVARCVAWWRRIMRTATVWFELHDPTIDALLAAHRPLLRAPICRVEVPHARTGTIADVEGQVRSELAFAAGRGPFLCDLVARDPSTRGRATVPSLALTVGMHHSAELSPAALIELVVTPDRVVLRGAADLGDDAIDRAAQSLAMVLTSTAHDQTLGELPVWGAADAALVAALDDTRLDHDRTATVTSQFLEQLASTPQAPAVSAGATTVTYAELGARVEALAEALAAKGVVAGDLVGIALERGIDLIASVLATLRLGAAYVPLDPGYPADRLRFMVEDAGLSVVAGRRATVPSVLGAGHAVTIVDPSDVPSEPASSTMADRAIRPEDTAYVIYTSGSTGIPKGVVLEHRNVVNFFAAMDEVIDVEPDATWLAVTSLSFDISVLELLWTLTRGVHVVVQQQSTKSASAEARRASEVGMSLFFFAAAESEAADGYRLLMESARFADREGFEAVWVPERHFHAFGGAYPNPSVIAAAVAVATERVAIRAGSVVLPLHSSARVAEDWAMVDNLSRGRVGVAVAPGWQPNDFVLNPSAFETARASMPQRIDEVRRLWRGESVELPGPDGATVATRTLPRPVQQELQVWLTSAGSPETFERAGRMGLHLLTHLLGQSVDQLGEHIRLYRRSWEEAGHDGAGRVTLMLHAYLTRDGSQSRTQSEAPMKRYLGSAAGLIKNLASAFPTLARAGDGADEAFRSLTDDEVDELLTVAAHRYIDTSGLFGAPEDAADLVSRVADLGVDEVACLIDFGVDTEDVLEALPLLAETRRLVCERRAAAAASAADSEVGTADGVAATVARHRVTHLQCTPSLAAMLLADPDDRAALAELRHLLVGGEALPEKLAAELRAVLRGRLTNMYGPTETTIWSLVHELPAVPDGPVPIGRPIANTTIEVLDDEELPVPVGALGQLHIGGEGVARGYLGRPELTAERFVARPGRGRTYATGDLVRLRPDGIVEFAGRVDHQVKVRGHRIELGEIESVLDQHPSIERSVVVARGVGAETRLVAFVVGRDGSVVDPGAARHHVAAHLPAIMVPEVIVALPTLPLTPNGKIDRNALPDEVAPSVAAGDLPSSPPADEWEALVVGVWTEQLARPVGRTDNFFEIGGHSLLAVAVFRRLQERTGAAIALTDVFRYPTVAAFARHLERLAGRATDAAPSAAAPVAASGADRAALRRQARARGRGDGGGGS